MHNSNSGKLNPSNLNIMQTNFFFITIISSIYKSMPLICHTCPLTIIIVLILFSEKAKKLTNIYKDGYFRALYPNTTYKI